MNATGQSDRGIVPWKESNESANPRRVGLEEILEGRPLATGNLTQIGRYWTQRQKKTCFPD